MRNKEGRDKRESVSLYIASLRRDTSKEKVRFCGMFMMPLAGTSSSLERNER